MPKRTHQPKVAKRAKVSGWRIRLSSASGRQVIKRRRSKGRSRLSA